MKMVLVILMVLMVICDARAFKSFPRLTAYNSPCTANAQLPDVPISVLETNTYLYITNMEFYYRQVGVGTQLLSRSYVITANDSNLPNPRVTSAASEISIAGNVVSYVSPAYATFTAVVSNAVTGVESGSTFNRIMYLAMPAATNNYAGGLVAESLANHVYTNFVARTNGRNYLLWSSYPYYTTNKNNFVRNPNFVLTGISNLTAISQCNEIQSARGHMPMTALTRRHALTRGHGFGYDVKDYTALTLAQRAAAIAVYDPAYPNAGTNSAVNGKEVIFVGHDNSIVTMIMTNRITFGETHPLGDFTIVSFTSDLPASITPIKVAITNINIGNYGGHYPQYPTNASLPVGIRPHLYLGTEQDGHLDTGASDANGPTYLGVPGFYFNAFKGGDSVSPNMLLIDNDLVMFSGRSTSPPGPTIQAAMDTLSIMSGLDPANYQLQWKDLSAFPVY